MAAPAWATDLTDIDLDPTGTGSYAALGGGPAGLNAETDYYIQGGGTPSMASKDAWTGAVRGLVNDTDGIPWTVPTDGVLLLWGIYTAPASLDTKSGGGLRLIAGSSASAYYEYYCGGSDTLSFETFVPYVVDPDTATADGTVGSPTGTWNAWGLVADLPSGGPTKGSPIGIDALRYGRHTIDYTAGEAADYNTFAKAEAYANALSRRWGNIEFNKGVYYVQGFHSFGTASALVDFRDSDRVIFIRAAGANCLTNDAVTTGYTRFEILNASSNVDWDNIVFTALGTRARGVFVHTAGTFDAVNCQFIGVDTFSLLSTSVMTDCVFRGTNAITAPGSDLSGSSIIEPTVALNTSPLIWDVATDPITKLANMTHEKGAAAHHAIEFGTTSPLTMTLDGNTFTGFNAANGQNDSALHIKRTSGTVTINITNGTAPSYKTEGATVNIVASVTVTLTNLVAGSEIRVYDKGDDSAIDGVESSGTSFAFSDTPANVVYIRIFKEDYYPDDIDPYTIPATATSIPRSQVFDRNYDNPA
jgi:hypothetical protein